jgi:hypothetical protein
MFKKIKFASTKGGLTKDFKKLTMCKKCYSFYYKKVWHFEAPDVVRDEEEPEVAVRFSQCPACVEQELTLYERDVDQLSYGF